MNFLLLILLDISASDDDSLSLSVSRRPLEDLIADWARRREEIVVGQNPPSPHRSQSIPSDGSHLKRQCRTHAQSSPPLGIHPHASISHLSLSYAAALRVASSHSRGCPLC
jgi:hypothetical protein